MRFRASSGCGWGVAWILLWFGAAMLTRPTSADEKRRERPKRVLVVDDDPGIRHLIWMVLRRAGIGVATAASTAEAEARMRDEEFWLLVTDHDMPRETGLNFVQRVRRGDSGLQSHRDIPIIMVSALDAPEHVEAVGAAGINALLQKPFRPDALTNVIRTMVDSEKDDADTGLLVVSTFN